MVSVGWSSVNPVIEILVGKPLKKLQTARLYPECASIHRETILAYPHVLSRLGLRRLGVLIAVFPEIYCPRVNRRRERKVKASNWLIYGF